VVQHAALGPFDVRPDVAVGRPVTGIVDHAIELALEKDRAP
jgi:hypothetical protein